MSTPCPLAEWTHAKGADRHPSCSIKIEPDGPSVYECHSQSCGSKGLFRRLVIEVFRRLGKPASLADLVEEVINAETVSIEREFERSAELFGPPPRKRMTVEEQEHANEVYSEEEIADFITAGAPPEFFARDFTEADAWEWEVGHDLKMRRMVFPTRRVGDRALVGAVGRALKKDQHPKYYNYWGFAKTKFFIGEQFLTDHVEAAVIVEGYFDTIRVRNALRANPEYANWIALGTFGADLSDRQAQRLLSLRAQSTSGLLLAAAAAPVPVFVFYDGDEAGREGTRDAIDKLTGRTIVADIEPPQGRDPSDFTDYGEIYALVEQAENRVGIRRRQKQ